MHLVRIQVIRLLVAAAVLVAAAPEGGSVAAGRLHLPLAGAPCPTSSFGSRRTSHIHAGVDFSTGGRTGVPVLAVDTCFVWRVSVKNGGYGRALYVVLPDGQVAVYGHLDRFAGPIEKMVVEEQNHQGAYEVELYPGSEAFRFMPGDTVAFSGETGAGPPHLHFELRSGRTDFDNLSPLPSRLDLREDSPPVIKRVRIVPLGPECLVNGKYGAMSLTPQGDQHDITVTGAFGVSVYANDVALCERVISPTCYEAWIDGELVWRMDLVAFPFAKTHYVRFLYDLVGSTPYVRLYDPFDLDLEGFSCYRPRGQRFFRSLAPGKHTLRVVVSDPWENSDEFAVGFTYGALPDFKTCRLDDSTCGTGFSASTEDEDCTLAASYRLPGGTWHEVAAQGGGRGWWGLVASVPSASDLEVLLRLTGSSGLARECVLATGGAGDGTRIETVLHPGFVEIYGYTDGPPRSLPQVEVTQGGEVAVLALQPVARNVFRGCYSPRGADGPIGVNAMFEYDRRSIERSSTLAVQRFSGGAIDLATGTYKIRLAGDKAGMESLVKVTEESGSGFEGFARCDGRLVFEPDEVFFEKAVDIEVSSTAGGLTPKHGLYSLAWGRVSLLAPFDSTGRCRARIYALDPIAVLQDTEPPSLRFVGNLLRKRDGTATFVGNTSDAGSGIDTQSIRAAIDGEPAVAAYDPDSGRITVRSTKPLPYGSHRLRLEAADRIGNVARSEIQRELLR